MRLAQIILPMHDNDGQDLWMEHQQLKFDLVKIWGGYTVLQCNGSWRSPEDGVTSNYSHVYQIAMPLADVVTLRQLVANLARQCRQQCIMIVTPNGDVDFVKPALDNVELAAVGTK